MSKNCESNIQPSYLDTLPTTRPSRRVAGCCAIGCEWPCCCAARRCVRSCSSSFCTRASARRGTLPWAKKSLHFVRRLSDRWARQRILELKFVLQTGQTPSEFTKNRMLFKILCLERSCDSSALDVGQLGRHPSCIGSHLMHTYVCMLLMLLPGILLLHLSAVESTKYMLWTAVFHACSWSNNSIQASISQLLLGIWRLCAPACFRIIRKSSLICAAHGKGLPLCCMHRMMYKACVLCLQMRLRYFSLARTSRQSIEGFAHSSLTCKSDNSQSLLNRMCPVILRSTRMYMVLSLEIPLTVIVRVCTLYMSLVRIKESRK